MNRRDWLLKSGLAAGGLMLTPAWTRAIRQNAENNQPHILLVSGWQTVNIGDIAHTPGLIHLLKTFIPEVKITLWPNDIDPEEEKSLMSHFPDLTIVYDDFHRTGIAGNEKVNKVIDEADFLLHGSGPGIVGLQKIQIWKKRTSKPYGVFGVTVGSVWDELREALNGAAFIYTRETHSLDVLRKGGVTQPELGFGPDATFFMPNRDDASAQFYMESRKLKGREFICIVPRLRHSPYHRIHVRVNWEREKIDRVIAENLKYAEEDHEKLRAVIIRYVQETGNKVLLCPEMQYQTELYEPYLYNPLPDDVKDHILMHPYWQPGAAASLYSHAAAVVSAECHSPIISLINGTPAIYLRQPSDTIKGQMYYDLKLDDWVFEIEETTGSHLSARVMDIINNFDQATEKVYQLNKRVKEIYEGNMDELRKHLDF